MHTCESYGVIGGEGLGGGGNEWNSVKFRLVESNMLGLIGRMCASWIGANEKAVVVRPESRL